MLVAGLNIAIGEWIFGLNGPFFFNRFGLSVPVAATAGCLVGAALGYGCTRGWFRLRSQHHDLSTVLRITENEIRAGLPAARHVFFGRHT